MNDNSKAGTAVSIAWLLLITPILTMMMVLPFGSEAQIIIADQEIDLSMIDNNPFIENLGQWDPRISLLAETDVGHIGLGNSRMIFHIMDIETPDNYHGDVLHYELLDSNDVRPIGRNALSGEKNYILGSDPSKWVSGARSFNSAHYDEVWDGIDLDYHLGDTSPKYEFVLEPFADPSQIKVGLRGSLSAEVVNKELVIELESGRIVRDSGLKAFYADDLTREIDVDFILMDEDTFSFEVGEYDEERGIIIDPSLIYSTFVGGTGMESFGRSVMDDSGNVYGVGTAWSYDFPFPPGAYSTNATIMGNAVVFKMNNTLSNLTYATYIGGESCDEGYSIALASNGEVIVSGMTMSSDFPTTEDAYQSSKYPEHFKYGYWDLFVLRLNNTGSGLVYSTYVGKEGTETFPLVSVDSSGNAVVTALSKMSNFTTTNDAYSKNYEGGASDIILFKLNRTGERLIYSTFIGGAETDEPGDILLVDDHLVYLTGRTNSTDFPTTSGAYDRTFNPNRTNENPYVMCFNLTSRSLKFSTYMSVGAGTAIAIDENMNIYVSGTTWSWRYQTTKGAFQENRTSGAYEGFLFKMDPLASRLIYSTLIGGSHHEYVKDIAINSSGCVFMLGATSSLDFPTTPGTYDNTSGGSMEAFISVFLPDASNISYSTYIGSSNYEMPLSINLWSGNHVYISGATSSATYPTTSQAYAPGFPGVQDFFISRLNCEKVYLPPDPPLNLTGSMERDRIELEWKMPEFDGFATIIGYNISRGITPGWGEFIGNTKDLSFNDTDFEVTQTYYYFVTAYNKIGTSLRSNEIIVMENEPPVINDDLTPGDVFPGMEMWFFVNVTDNAALDEVNVVYHIEGESVVNKTMWWNNGEDIRSYLVYLPDRELDLRYHFYAKDKKDNQVETEDVVIQVRGPYLPFFLEDMTVQKVASLSDLTFQTKIVDNWGIDEVYLEYWFNEGYHRNRTMDHVSGYQYDHRIVVTGMPGDVLHYRFSARDIHGNWNYVGMKDIQIIDSEKPELIEDLTSDQATTGESVTFRFEIVDDHGPLKVKLYYRYGNDTVRSLDLDRSFGTCFEYTMGIPHATNDLSYSLELSDGSNNTITYPERIIKIFDNDLPELISDESDGSAENGGQFRFKCKVDDNVGIESVDIEHWINNGNENHFSLDYEGGSYIGAVLIPDDRKGDFRYRIHVQDTSGNIIVGPLVNIPMIDPIPPTIEVMEDITTYVDHEVMIDVDPSDNIGIVKIIWSGLPTVWSGSKWKGSFSEIGEKNINILIEDASGNEATTSFNIVVLPLDHDSDGDGIPDVIEMELGLSYLDPADGGFDLDEDGLNNSKEYHIGSSIVMNDTDNDGMPDGWEMQKGLDPLTPSDMADPDRDGFSNLEEFIRGSHPFVFDEVEVEENDIPSGNVNILLASLVIIGIMALIMLAFIRYKKR